MGDKQEWGYQAMAVSISWIILETVVRLDKPGLKIH